MNDQISIKLHGTLGDFNLNVNFALPMHGISALFGPSGCGKTSILRCVAGLNHLPGRIQVGDDIWQDEKHFLPIHQRSIGYVFQEASLFPHLNVRKNLAYGEKRAQISDRHIHFDEIIELLGITHLLARSPVHLSGGERQRVSIARALLSQPRLLLMDEPLSALDRMAKDEILPYLEALHARLHIPMLLVSHDIAEVERLADHLVLLKSGKLVASGPLSDVLSAPHSPLSQRRDFAAVLPAEVIERAADGILTLNVAGCSLYVAAQNLQDATKLRLRIAASDVSIARTCSDDSSILNAVDARIIGIEDLNEAEVNIRLDIGKSAPAPIRARISKRSLDRLGLQQGENVFAQIKTVSMTANR